MNELGDYFDIQRGSQKTNSDDINQFKYEKSEVENCNAKSIRVEASSKKADPIRAMTPSHKANLNFALKKKQEDISDSVEN